jgi:hypothetical protein
VSKPDWNEWAIRVREYADDRCMCVHGAFDEVPRPQWAHDALSRETSALVMMTVYLEMRRRVCRLAGSLVAVDIRTGPGPRKVAV